MRLLKHSTVSQWEASLEDADGITRVERTLLSYATVTHSLLVSSKLSGLLYPREECSLYHEYTQIQNIMVNLSEEPFDWYVEDVTGVRYS